MLLMSTTALGEVRSVRGTRRVGGRDVSRWREGRVPFGGGTCRVSIADILGVVTLSEAVLLFS